MRPPIALRPAYLRLQESLSEQQLLRNLTAKLLALGLGFAANLVTIRLLTANFGASGYALFALIASILIAAPFADLGTGAAIINLTSDLASGAVGPNTYKYALKRVLAIDLLSGAAIATFAIAMLLFGGWPILLSHLAHQAGGSLCLTIVVIMLAVSIPLGVGGRALQGLGRSELNTYWGLIASPIQFAVVALLYFLHAPAAYYALGLSITVLASSIGISVHAVLRVRSLLTSDDHRERKATPVMHSAMPYLVTLVAATVAFQIDRLILVHVSSTSAVAGYSLVGQFVVPGLSLTVLASANLWPIFRRRLNSSQLTLRYVNGQLGVYICLGLLIALPVLIIIELFGSLLVSHSFYTSQATLLFGLGYLVIASGQKPLSMLLSDVPGLWIQAGSAIAAATASFVLTVYWGRSYGAAGAYAASLAAVGTMQLLPQWGVARWRLARRNIALPVR